MTPSPTVLDKSEDVNECDMGNQFEHNTETYLKTDTKVVVTL